MARREILNKRLQVLDLLLQQATVTRRRQAYMRWQRWLLRRKNTHRKVAVAQAIVTVSEHGLGVVFFRKWLAYLRHLAVVRSEQRKAQAEADLQAVKDKYAGMEAVIAEKRRLDAMEEELNREAAALEEQEMAIRRLEVTAADLEKELAEAAARARREQQSLAEQFATLIAQLKSHVINFHQDAALIAQLRDKSKSVPITKLFLEAHQQVKRVVVEVTGKPHLAGATEPWPLTPQKLASVPGHQWSVVLAAIKTMIVTFDLMDRATRDSLQSDQEIVTNASWLLQMAELSNEHRRRTLGHGAARVK